MRRSPGTARKSLSFTNSLESGTQEVCTQVDYSQGSMKSPVAPPTTRLVSIDRSYRHIELDGIGSEVTFGRASSNTVQVKLPTVSGLHCRVVCRGDDEYWLQDLSSNGTYRNKTRVGKGNRVLLVQGDVISLSKKGVRRGSDECSWIFQSRFTDHVDAALQDYIMMQELGRGGFSVVKLAVHRETYVKHAIKIIDKVRISGKAQSAAALQREVEILRRLRHPNVTQVIDVIDSPDKLYIVLEYASGGELFDLVKKGPLAEVEARRIFRQLLGAVKYLHDNNMVHRDLKLENVLLDSTLPGANVKLTDFGLSRMTGAQELMKTQCGTPMYVAPEIFALSAPSRMFDSQPVQGYDEKVDMWALGVMLYVMLAGHFPWNEENNMHQHILNATFSFDSPRWRHVSDAAKLMIRQLLRVEPEARLAADQALEHAWLNGSEDDGEFAVPTPPPESSSASKRKLLDTVDSTAKLTPLSDRQQKRVAPSPPNEQVRIRKKLPFQTP